MFDVTTRNIARDNYIETKTDDTPMKHELLLKFRKNVCWQVQLQFTSMLSASHAASLDDTTRIKTFSNPPVA